MDTIVRIFACLYILLYACLRGECTTSFINIRQGKNTLIQRIKISNIIFIATTSDAILAPRGYYLFRYINILINLSIYTLF